jgi:MerR family redox-sensitive transcriptional activator SoxR
MSDPFIDISELAARSGVAASALRFYETCGLIKSVRLPGKRRQFSRSTLRKVAFIRAAQTVGLPLEAIKHALDGLPSGRTPTRADWQNLSSQWAVLLDEKIAALNRLRSSLGACIGCGCLTFKRCALYNPKDAARVRGSGARYLLGDSPRDFMRTDEQKQHPKAPLPSGGHGRDSTE